MRKRYARLWTDRWDAALVLVPLLALAPGIAQAVIAPELEADGWREVGGGLDRVMAKPSVGFWREAVGPPLARGGSRKSPGQVAAALEKARRCEG